MRTRFGKRGLLVMILAVLALALVSCGNKEEPDATEQPGPAVQSVGVGDRITTDFIDLTIEQAGTVDKIKPSDPDPTSLFVISKAPGTDETYFCVTGLVKNIGRDAYNLGDIFVKISFDGTYNYSGYVTADTGRDLSDWPELKPLASVRYYFYTPVPNEMIESFSTVTVRFAFNDNLKPVAHYWYLMDEPECEAEMQPQRYAMGVSALTALDDGRLLVLEREFAVPQAKLGAFVNCKIYEVNPRQSRQASQTRPKNKDGFLPKKLVAEWMTAIGLLDFSIANYEGMCLGPKLADGGQVIVLIADSQNQYAGILSDWLKTIVIY